MRDLRALIERVEKEGASYDLDVAIAQTLVPQIVVLRQRNDNSGADPHTYRCFTTKVDDAIWLSSVLLPGQGFILETTYGGNRAGIGKSGRFPSPGATPAIALLLATLRALEAQESGR